MRKIIYPEKLSIFLTQNSNNYIPRRLKSSENKLKLYRRYWSVHYNYSFKVDKIYMVDKVEYYVIKYLNQYIGNLSTPINPDYIFELCLDKNNIKEIDIINSNKSYSGAEIKYWFFNKDHQTYSAFRTFLDYTSDNVLSDNKYYFVNAIIEHGKYKDCKIIIDKKILG